jgi:hypothetical protein
MQIYKHEVSLYALAFFGPYCNQFTDSQLVV